MNYLTEYITKVPIDISCIFENLSVRIYKKDTDETKK